MAEWIDMEAVGAFLADLGAAVAAFLFDPVHVAEVAALGLSLALGWFAVRSVAGRFWKARPVEALVGRFPRVAEIGQSVNFPILWLLVVWAFVLIAQTLAWPHGLLSSALTLITAWVIIRSISHFVSDPGLSKTIAVAAWGLAALYVVGFLGPTVAALDALALNMGDFRISVLGVLKGVLLFAGLLWLANFGTGALETRLLAASRITPSLQVLFVKLSKVTLITIAVALGLSSIGIDLTAFAVFSGAIGIGIGFGLQKIVANLFSGVILLLDKSVKPGDVIGVAGTYGYVNSLGARYISVITRDGVEHLIPNEDVITQRVENWSYSDQLVRLRVPFGVSYNSDVDKAIDLAVEAAAAHPRVLDSPAPKGLMLGFGSSAIDLELRFWIGDPENGLGGVKSDVLRSLWRKFRAEGVEIPFPQLDLHLRTGDARVVTNGEAPGLDEAGT